MAPTPPANRLVATFFPAFVAWCLWLLAAGQAHAQPLTAAQAVRRAAVTNPTLKASHHDLEAAKHSLEAEQNARVPTLVAGADGQYSERFGATSEGISRNSDESINTDVAVRYTTDIGTAIETGVSSSVSWRTTNRDPGTTESVTTGPTVSSTATLSVRQPLLKGAGTDSNLAGVRAAQAGREQAEHGHDEARSQLVLDVLSAYLDLWYAQQAVKVQEQALALAQRQHDEAQLRATELQTEAPANVLHYATELASIRESLLQARASRRTAAIELGRLIGVKPAKAAALVATSPPRAPGTLRPLSDLTATARRASAELLALGAQVQAARERLKKTASSAQPRLDLLSSLSMSGVWIDDDLPGLRLPGDRPAFAVMGGLELELPLGHGQPRAEHARALAELRAAEERLRAREEALEAEVAAARIDVQTAGQSVDLSAKTSAVARQLAEAEQQRLTLGKSTPYDAIKAQQSVREAELRRLRAQVDHTKNALRLDHQIGALLPRYAHYFGSAS